MKKSPTLPITYLLVFIMICLFSCKKTVSPNVRSTIVGTWVQYQGAQDANDNHIPDPSEIISDANGSGETLPLTMMELVNQYQGAQHSISIGH